MEIPVQKETCGCTEHARDGGVIPVTGFPRDGGTAKEGHRKDDSITVQNSSISFNTYIRSTAVVSGYTFEACIRGGTSSERCRGSRRSRDVVEVVVRGDGSGTHVAGVLVGPVLATVVVEVVVLARR